MARSATNDTLLAIGDCHFPWACAETVRKIIAAVAKHQPRYIVQVGDLYDQYGFSRYGKSLNVMTPADELANARNHATLMWSEIRKLSPATKCYQLLGNHDMRLAKKVQEKLPELAGLVDAGSLFSFKGVESMKTDRDILELTVQGESVAAHHGFLSKIGDHLRYFGKSCIIGHSHRPHVLPAGNKYELNVGYAGDPTSEVFSYGATIKNHWTRGYGLIDSLGPRFVSLEGAV
jgi:predicted MPP superfamily phosphohydrolase